MLLNRSWGARGHPFAQHYSCPAFLDAQLVLQVAAVGIFFRMWSIASIAQGQALRSIGKAATSLLPPSPPLYFSFQNECASYTGRSGRASLRSRRLAGRWSSSSSRRLAISLCPLRGHLILSKTAPSVCLLQNENASMKSFGQIDSSWRKAHLPMLRSDSFQKFATASQTLDFEKAVFAPNWFFPADATRRHADFQNCGGSARSGLKSLIQNKQIQNYTL